MSDPNAAWTDFWAQQRGQGSTGCLPARWQSVFTVLETTWRGFAATLPQDARVLDLATGDARVLHWIGEERADIARVGIDLAPDLPPAPPGVDIRMGVAMENLPFEDAGFDSVVSQFGVEYGEIPDVAREIARVAKPGAAIGLVVHRGDGAILAHNLARAEQIAWVADEIDLFRSTKAAIEREPAPWTAAVAKVAQTVERGRERFGDQSAAWEIPEAVRRSLVMGARAGDDAQGVASLLDRIASQASNERARIASLQSACETADARDDFLATFSANGIGSTGGEPLTDAAGRIFAEFLRFEAN